MRLLVAMTIRWQAAYYFGLVSLLAAVVMTAAYIEAENRLENLQRPYKIQYASLSEMELYFRVLDAYDDLEKYAQASTNAGDWNYPEIFKRCMRLDSYITEMRHRQVGDIALSPVQRNWLRVECELYYQRHGTEYH